MNIAIFVQSFPAISEIWIVNQIVSLLDDGHHVDIFAQFRSEDTRIHQKVLDYDLLSKTTYIDSLPNSRLPKLKLFFTKILKHLHFRNMLLFYHYVIYVLISKKKGISFYSTIHFVDKPRYDIAHAHYGFNGKYVLLLQHIGLLRNTRLVTSFHGFDFKVSEGFYNALFEKGDMFIVNSQYSWSKLLSLGCTDEKIIKLPVGLQTDYFEKKYSPTSNTFNPFSIVFVGRFVEFKSPLTFIEICKQLSEKNITYKARMIGDGDLLESVKSQIKKYQLEEHVILYGKQTQEEIKFHLLNSDVFVLTGVVDSNGIAETQGLVIQEAQSMELPVIVSDAGGMNEGMIDNETGFVIQNNSVDEFVEKIIFLKNNDTVRLEMGRKGREFVLEKYNVARLNKKLVDVYNELIEKRW